MPRYNEPTHRAAKILVAYTFVVCTATHPEGDASTDARCRGEHHADDAEPKGVDGLRRRPKARHAGEVQEWRRMMMNRAEPFGRAWPHTSSYVRRTKVEGSHQFGCLVRFFVLVSTNSPSKNANTGLFLRFNHAKRRQPWQTHKQ